MQRDVRRLTDVQGLTLCSNCLLNVEQEWACEVCHYVHCRMCWVDHACQPPREETCDDCETHVPSMYCQECDKRICDQCFVINGWECGSCLNGGTVRLDMRPQRSLRLHELKSSKE